MRMPLACPIVSRVLRASRNCWVRTTLLHARAPCVANMAATRRESSEKGLRLFGVQVQRTHARLIGEHGHRQHAANWCVRERIGLILRRQFRIDATSCKGHCTQQHSSQRTSRSPDLVVKITDFSAFIFNREKYWFCANIHDKALVPHYSNTSDTLPYNSVVVWPLRIFEARSTKENDYPPKDKLGDVIGRPIHLLACIRCKRADLEASSAFGRPMDCPRARRASRPAERRSRPSSNCNSVRLARTPATSAPWRPMYQCPREVSVKNDAPLT
jgi:hypothetical protein